MLCCFGFCPSKQRPKKKKKASSRKDRDFVKICAHLRTYLRRERHFGRASNDNRALCFLLYLNNLWKKELRNIFAQADLLMCFIIHEKFSTQKTENFSAPSFFLVSPHLATRWCLFSCVDIEKFPVFVFFSISLTKNSPCLNSFATIEGHFEGIEKIISNSQIKVFFFLFFVCFSGTWI